MAGFLCKGSWLIEGAESIDSEGVGEQSIPEASSTID
jgi:hypothetical protein